MDAADEGRLLGGPPLQKPPGTGFVCEGDSTPRLQSIRNLLQLLHGPTCVLRSLLEQRICTLSVSI